MKSTIKAFLFIAPILFASCADASETSKRSSRSKRAKAKTSAQAPQQKPSLQNISAKQFKEMSDSGNGIILDVRTPGETARGSISGASFISINDKEFLQKVSFMQKDKPIYVYCATGSRSSYAAKVMIQNGFKEVYNLNGGINAWARSGYPVTKPAAGVDVNVKQLTLDEFGKMLSTKEPVLVDFHTEWCSPCRKMAPIVDALKEENKGKVTVLRLDVDKSKEVAKFYGIQGVPVFIIYVNGKEIWRHSGAMAKEALQAEMTKATKK